MMSFIKKLFSPIKERKVDIEKFDIEEEYNKLLKHIEKHKSFYPSNLSGFSDFFDYSGFIDHVKNSEYVNTYIKEKTLERLAVLRPLFIHKYEMDKYLFICIDFFLKYEFKSISNTMTHIEDIKECNKMINENIENINNYIREVLLTINEAKSKMNEFSECIEKLDNSYDTTKKS